MEQMAILIHVCYEDRTTVYCLRSKDKMFKFHALHCEKMTISSCCFLSGFDFVLVSDICLHTEKLSMQSSFLYFMIAQIKLAVKSSWCFCYNSLSENVKDWLDFSPSSSHLKNCNTRTLYHIPHIYKSRNLQLYRDIACIYIFIVIDNNTPQRRKILQRDAMQYQL